MTRKKRTVIETEIEPDSGEAEPLDAGPIEDEDIAGFVESFGPGVKKVSVYRFDKTGRPAYVGGLPPGAVNDGVIQEKFGGGDFLVKLLDEGGRYIKQKAVVIEAPKPEPSSMSTVADPGVRVQLEMMREAMGRQQEMIMRLIEKGSTPPAGNDLVKVIEAVGTLRDIASPQTQIQGIVSALTEGLRLGMKNSGSGNGDSKIDGILKVVDRVTEFLPRVIPRPADHTPTGAGDNPGGGPLAGASGRNSGGDPEAAALRGAVDYLKTKITKSPELWAEWIADNLEEAHWLILVRLITKPYEEIIVALGDPDLQREPYRAWFSKLISELREIVQGDKSNPDSLGPSGNRDGAAPNEDSSS